MRVFVTGIAGANALNTVSVLDGFTKANDAWRFLGDSNAGDLFDTVAVGTSGRAIEFANGFRLEPGQTADDAGVPDLVVVPGLDDDVDASLERNREWVSWVRRWHDEGAVVASSCTGAFILGDAGLLDGLRATTHWVAEAYFRARYPSTTVSIQSIVVDEGSVITSGGATTAFNLLLYLISRFGSAERAHAATRMMLLDSQRDSQLPFSLVAIHRQHTDALVHEAQVAVQQGLVEPTSVEGVSRHIGVSTRTLSRRFQTALGMPPSAYLEAVRLESARRLLEATDLSVHEIAGRIGFGDSTSFRRAFKRSAGVSPLEYRRRYSS